MIGQLRLEVVAVKGVPAPTGTPMTNEVIEPGVHNLQLCQGNLLRLAARARRVTPGTTGKHPPARSETS